MSDDDLRRADPPVHLHKSRGWCDGCIEYGAALAARPEPRAEGLSPFVIRECPNCGAMLRVRQVAATPPAPAPLDVERLGMALAVVGWTGLDAKQQAEAIAREYAALAPEQPE